jgi:hypothetical protein
VFCADNDELHTVRLRCLSPWSIQVIGSLIWGEGGPISLWLYKENNKLPDWKNVFTVHIPPSHTYDFVVLNHPRKILLVVLQIGKAKDLSASLCITNMNPLGTLISHVWNWHNKYNTKKYFMLFMPKINTVSCKDGTTTLKHLAYLVNGINKLWLCSL